jgi:thiol:disulfide interchange protein DsbG
MKKTTLLTALLVALSANAIAQAAAPAVKAAPAAKSTKAEANLPPALVGAMRTGVTIEKTFAAESGMTGYVLNRNGQFSIVFATPDKKTLVNGILIAADGRNTAPEYENKYIPKPNLDALWPSLEKAAVVVTGAKGPAVKAVVYAFIDPNCGFCHLAWKAFKPYEATGLQVRWLPVGFLGPTSAPKAAYFMQAADQGAALDKLVDNFKNGGVDAKTLAGVTVKPETQAKLDANSKVMQSFGFGGTPAMIWRDKSGKVLSKNGMPRLSELPGMFNLPAVENPAPELDNFR